MGGASSVNCAASGAGVNTAPTVTTPTSTSITTTTATLGGNLTIIGCNTVTERGVFWSTTNGFADGTGTKVSETGTFSSTGTFTVGVSELSASTTYYYKAFATSSSGVAYSIQGTFTTACGAVNIPYSQNFESVAVPAIPTCNTIENAGTGNNWITVSNPGNGFTSKTLKYPFHSTNAANAWYYTDGLNLIGGKTYILTFKYGCASATYPEKLKVMYGTSTSNASMSIVLYDNGNVTNVTPNTQEVNFTPSLTGVYYIGFNAYSAKNMYDLYVDDILVELEPTCIVPTNVTSNTITSTTATISWIASASNPTNGYQYEVRTSGEAGSGSTGLTASGNTGAGVVNKAITDLSPNTSYNVYVRSDCGASDYSAWTTIYSFTTSQLIAPTATAASTTTATSFTANWEALSGASEYKLDVATNINFISPIIIANENFENSLTQFTESTGTGSFYNGSSASGDSPASSPFSQNDSFGYGKTYGSVTITSNDFNTVQYTNVQLNFKLAAFSIPSSNGLDGGDIVTVFVSPDGGTNYYPTLRVLGKSNAIWAFNASGIASTVYDGNVNPVDFTTTSGGLNSDGLSDITITGLPIVSNLKIRITLLNDNSAERWIIDNFSLTGNQNSNLSNYNDKEVSGTTQEVTGLTPNTTYYYRVRAVGGNSTSANSNTITVATTNTIPVTSGEVSVSTLPVCPTCDVTVSEGATLTINESKTFSSVTVAPGAKLTLNNGSTFSPGTFVLQSSGSATATFVDARSDANKTYIPATVQQYLPQGRNWYVGIPIVSGSASTLTAAGLSTSVSYWDETVGDWENNYAGTLTPGIGYIGVSTPAAGSGTNNVSFTGNLNTGNFPVTVTRTVTAANKPGFNLIANPYPSYLNPCALITGKTKLEPTIWYRTAVWLGEPDNKYLYSFETVNTADGVGTHGVTGYIPPMQAFWVKVLPNANPANNNSEELIFTNAMRYHSNPTIEEETITTTPLKAKESVSKKVVRLRVSNGITNDEAVLYSNANAQNSFDKFDSRKMSNDNVAIPEIFTVVDNEQLVINGYNQLPMDVEIPLGFKTGKAGIFTLRANEIKNLNENTALVVKDKVLNLEYNLTNGDAYEFSSAVVNDANRFSIILKTSGSANGIENTKLNTSTSVFVNTNGELMVKTSAPLSADAKVSVYNAVGQLISIKPLSSGMTIANAARAAGVYWVKITNDGEMVTRKVIVN